MMLRYWFNFSKGRSSAPNKTIVFVDLSSKASDETIVIHLRRLSKRCQQLVREWATIHHGFVDDHLLMTI